MRNMFSIMRPVCSPFCVKEKFAVFFYWGSPFRDVWTSPQFLTHQNLPQQFGFVSVPAWQVIVVSSIGIAALMSLSALVHPAAVGDRQEFAIFNLTRNGLMIFDVLILGAYWVSREWRLFVLFVYTPKQWVKLVGSFFGFLHRQWLCHGIFWHNLCFTCPLVSLLVSGFPMRWLSRHDSLFNSALVLGFSVLVKIQTLSDGSHQRFHFSPLVSFFFGLPLPPFPCMASYLESIRRWFINLFSFLSLSLSLFPLVSAHVWEYALPCFPKELCCWGYQFLLGSDSVQRLPWCPTCLCFFLTRLITCFRVWLEPSCCLRSMRV